MKYSSIRIESPFFLPSLAWLLSLGCLELSGWGQTGLAEEKSQSVEVPSDPDKKLALFLELAEELRQDIGVPGVGFGLVLNKKPFYVGGLGFRHVQNKLPVDEDTLFAIGSNTKAFTGVLAAKLVSEGSLTWKDPIRRVLPQFRLEEEYVARWMNLEDALTHMTGISRRDDLWKGQDLTREEVYEQVQTLAFQFSLRGEFSYNNHMYVVAGKVIETLLETTWEQGIRELIFDPLEMTDSYVSYEEFMSHPKKSTGYAADGVSVVPHVNVDNMAPAGSISSTPRDIMKWIEMWVNEGLSQGERVLLESEYEYLTGPKTMSLLGPRTVRYYAIGWAGTQTDGKKVLGHSGGIDGQNALFVIRPEDGYGAYFLTNQISDYKYLISDYAEEIFVEGKLTRDVEREAELKGIQDFVKFERLLGTDGIAAAQEYYQALPQRQFEDLMNRLGYALLANADLTKAAFVFQLNVDDHPDSSNAHDSMGECLLAQKKYAQALDAYERALELDPRNGNARMMLEKVKREREDKSIGGGR